MQRSEERISRHAWGQVCQIGKPRAYNNEQPWRMTIATAEAAAGETDSSAIPAKLACPASRSACRQSHSQLCCDGAAVDNRHLKVRTGGRPSACMSEKERHRRSGRPATWLPDSVSGNAFHTPIEASQLGTPGLRSTNGVNLETKLDFRPTAEDSLQLTLTHTDARLTAQGRVRAINLVNVDYKRPLTSAMIHGRHRLGTVMAEAVKANRVPDSLSPSRPHTAA